MELRTYHPIITRPGQCRPPKIAPADFRPVRTAVKGSPISVEYAGAIYHVLNRGDHREAIVRDDEDRRRFSATPGEDLASRYRFRPLVSDRLDGRQIATHLESLFRQHGAPLFLKRDNGSPFNCQPVDEVMARFGVLPLNNPPHFPRYNGAQEKGIRDLKAALDQRQQHTGHVPKDLALAVEVTAHELNHRSRRCLKGRTACAVWNDANQHLRWTKRQRQTIFRLLLCQFGAIVGKTTNGTHLKPATAWRVTVETWLRCQDLIAVHQNQKPNVSTTFQKIWSHN
jgi:hypothetical protein